MQKIRECIFQICIILSKRRILRLDDQKYIKMMYKLKFGKSLNLNNPRTFNEKLQWLKLYDRNDIYTIMVDKNLSKNYVENLIGKEYIIPTIGVYQSFEDIEFDKLPDQFVIKCTHDSGGLVICNNKKDLNLVEAKKKINNCLKKNYYYSGREWPYKKVVPQVLVENYMIDEELNELRDYKFFCFNGVVKVFKIDFDRYINHHANYYDRSAKLLDLGEVVCPPDFDKNLKMPNNLNKMIELAEKLSKDIPFLRVDFYEINNKIYFGELTFFPASGFGKFIDDKWDLKLGEFITLPKGE